MAVRPALNLKADTLVSVIPDENGVYMIMGLDECFIATAAYGSKLDPAVVLLRQFRDKKLLASKPGQTFVNLYYTYSPALARFIGENELLKFTARGLLLPIIALAYILMNIEVVLIVLTLVAFCTLTLRPGYLYRGRKTN